MKSTRVLSLLLLLLTALQCVALPVQQPSPTPQDRDGEEIKRQLEKRGVGKTVHITLRDGRDIRGTITQLDDQTFAIDNGQSVTTIAYGDVVRVRGPGLARRAKFLIGVGIGLAVSAILIGHELGM